MEPVLEQMIRKYPEMDICLPDIRLAVDLLHHTYTNGGKVLVCGNGGSASDSEHIVGELMKGFMLRRPVNESVRARLNEAFPGQGNYLADHLQGALPAISLVSQSALASAFINDVEPDMVFAQQVFGYAKEGDAVIGLSTSGNSKNVLHALQVAKAMGARTIGLTGCSGGLMKEVCDTIIRVPYDSTPDIQERHLPVYHAICMILEEAFFPS